MNVILIVEDEQHLADGLRFNLEAEGYEVAVAADGETALRLLLTENRKFDAVVLDVMLPGRDGFEVASELRAAGRFVPILMARLRGLLRRSEWFQRDRERAQSRAAAPESADVFSFAGRTIDFSRLELHTAPNGEVIQLTLMEAKLLRHLINRQGRAVSRKEILEEVWDLHEDTDTRAIDNFIVRLRKYLEPDPARPRHLLTVRGLGYRFVAEPETGQTPH